MAVLLAAGCCSGATAPMATVGAVGVLVVLQMVFVDGKNVATA